MRTNPPLVVCLDANVIVSAIAFGGTPLEIVDRALCRDFLLVLGPNIITTVRRILTEKLALKKSAIATVLDDLINVASMFLPTGQLHPTIDEEDNRVLEIALLGDCNILVTGDKRHLLPLQSFQSIIIEPPSKFLARLGRK